METYLVIYGKPRFLGHLPLEIPIPLERGEWVNVETDRGEELAVIVGHCQGNVTERGQGCCAKGQSEGCNNKQSPNKNNEKPLSQALRFVAKASPEILQERKMLESEEALILSEARKILRSHNLSMKLVDAEFLLGKSKLFLYFTSEDRVDFRSYVRDLAKEFKTRIELRQIGIRDEARVVGGLASCGRQCCCSSWLHQFSPICIRMVKEQNLALNPAKISGICGRLMCCIAYEHPTYKEIWNQLPNPGTKIRGPESTYVLAGVDIRSKAVKIIGMGEEHSIPVEKYQEFKAVIQKGGKWSQESTDQALEKGLPSLQEKENHPKGSSSKPALEGPRESPLKEKKGEPAGKPEEKRTTKRSRRRKPYKKGSVSSTQIGQDQSDKEKSSPGRKPGSQENRSEKKRASRNNEQKKERKKFSGAHKGGSPTSSSGKKLPGQQPSGKPVGASQNKKQEQTRKPLEISSSHGNSHEKEGVSQRNKKRYSKKRRPPQRKVDSSRNSSPTKDS